MTYTVPQILTSSATYYDRNQTPITSQRTALEGGCSQKHTALEAGLAARGLQHYVGVAAAVSSLILCAMHPLLDIRVNLSCVMERG